MILRIYSPYEVLLDSLPEELAGPCGPTTLNYLREKLSSGQLNLSWTIDHTIRGLGDDVWQTWYGELTESDNQKSMSYKTRKRYQKHLMTIAQDYWRRYLPVSPKIQVSSQYSSRQAFSPERLQYRPGDYQHLIKVLKGILQGEVKSEDFVGMVTANPAAFLGLLLIINGVMRDNPVEALTLLSWEDVIPITEDFMLLKVWRRNSIGYTYLSLFPLTQTVLWSVKYKYSRKDLFGPIFQEDNDQLRKSINDLLVCLCNHADLPPLKIQQLAYLVRFELIGVLNNLEISVLSAQVPYRPVPADQAKRYFLEYEGFARNVDSIIFLQDKLSLDSEAVDDDYLDDPQDDLYPVINLLEKVQPLVSTLLETDKVYRNSTGGKEDIRQAKAALEEIVAEEPMFFYPPIKNIYWLVRWMLYNYDRRKNVGTIRAYWFSGLRLIRFAGNIPLINISEDIISELLELDYYEASTHRSTKSAIKDFWGFLKKHNQPVREIDWESLDVQQTYDPVRVLFPSDFEKLWRSFENEVGARAVFFTGNSGLRVSELCHLIGGDLVMDYPYLVIVGAKRNGKRRINLRHIPADHLERIQSYLSTVLKNGPDTPFISPGNNNQFLDPKDLSEMVSNKMREMGLIDAELEGKPVSFHSLRAYYAWQLYISSGEDIRVVAFTLGHAWVLTTIGNYLHIVDLEAARKIKDWDFPLNDPGLVLPYEILAAFWGLSSTSRIRQLIKEYDGNYEEELPVMQYSEINGVSANAGKPKHYLPVKAALALALDRVGRAC